MERKQYAFAFCFSVTKSSQTDRYHNSPQIDELRNGALGYNSTSFLVSNYFRWYSRSFTLLMFLCFFIVNYIQYTLSNYFDLRRYRKIFHKTQCKKSAKSTICQPY